MKSITSVLSAGLLAMAVMFVGCAEQPAENTSDVKTSSTADACPNCTDGETCTACSEASACACTKGECTDCKTDCCGKCEGKTCACTDSECTDCEAKDGECCGKCSAESKACACSKGSCDDCKNDAKCCGKCGGDKPAPAVPVTTEEAAK